MTIPFINETESKAIQCRKELLEQLKQSNLVKELIKCHDVALDEEKTINERYEALKFISENENLYDSLKSYHVIPAAQIGEKSIDTVSILDMFELNGNRMDYSELSKVINFIFPTEAVFKVDLDYITSYGKNKISISQMEKYLTYILSHTHKEIYQSTQSVLPNISTLEEYMQGFNVDEYDDWTYKNFGYFKEYIEQKLFIKKVLKKKFNIYYKFINKLLFIIMHLQYHFQWIMKAISIVQAHYFVHNKKFYFVYEQKLI